MGLPAGDAHSGGAVYSVPSANQEAGLRIEMSIQVNNILRFAADNGRLSNDLGELGDNPAALQYVPLGENAFQLSGQAGDIKVYFNSNDPVSDLLSDAIAIVSGGVSPTPAGSPAI